MPESRRTAVIYHKKKKKELQQRNHLGTGKTLGMCFKLVHSIETSPLIIMQLQVTNICSIRIVGPLPNQWNITVKHIQPYTLLWNEGETSMAILNQSKRKIINRTMKSPTEKSDSQVPTYWNRYRSVWGLNNRHCRENKKGSKVTNNN